MTDKDLKNIMDQSGFIYQGYISGHLRYKKRITQKQWESFKVVNVKEIEGKLYYLDVQEYMCKKYDIVITDWQKKPTKRQKALAWMKKNLTQKNLDKGIKTMNEGITAFTKELDSFTGALGDGSKKTSDKRLKQLVGSQRGSNVKIWSPKRSSMSITGKPKRINITGNPSKVKIWSDRPVQKRKSKRKSRKGNNHMETIWGKRR